MSAGSTDPTSSDGTNKVNSINELDIEFGHGVSEEDKNLSRRDKNAVEFAFTHSKLWCKTCKDIVLGLEKRSYAENDAYRAIVKQFQALEASIQASNGAPMKQQLTDLYKKIIEHHKDMETHNTKRIRELLGVLTRQRTTFEKTRKFLKEKWKTDLKRMLDAENSLIKTKSAYYQRCQIGVKLREELAAAQNLLNELNTSQASVTSNLSNSNLQISSVSSPMCSLPSTPGTPASQTLNTSLTSDAAQAELLVDVPGSAASTSSNQIIRQRAKVERLEKQLCDNDKKEIDQMYAYREAVDTANSRLCDLEKSKMEILCDIRLTILKSDEVVKDSLAELFHHFYTTRLDMINQYDLLASEFQNYVPCSDYRTLIEEHIQKCTDYYPEKYQYLGYHEAAMSGQKFDALSSRFLGRTTQTARDINETDALSDSESEGDADTTTTTVVSNAKSTSTNVLSSLVEFGSNLFRPDSKKSFRNRRTQQSGTSVAISGSATAELANLEKEFVSASLPIGRCIISIEKQSGGFEVPGIYRVPASKAKLASLSEHLQTTEPSTLEQLDDDIAVLTQEHPLTLAGMVKTRLLALSEPLFTYNLYPNFVDLGKAFDAPEAVNELISRLRMLINNLTKGNRQLAGLLFHHLHRVASYECENKMSSLSLGTMFAPTVLRQRPKFQVPNMMDLIDNKSQTRVAEVLIDYASEVFGPEDQYDPMHVLQALVTTESVEQDSRRHSGPSTGRNSSTKCDNTNLGNRSKIAIPHTQVTRTHSSSFEPDVNTSPTAGQQQQSQQAQQGLTRSATVVATTRGRSSDTPINILHPYGKQHSNISSDLSTPPNVRTCQGSETAGILEHHSVIPNRLRLTKMTGDPTQIGPTNTNTSVMRNSRRRYGISPSNSGTSSITTKHTSNDSQTGSSLSNLVIGRQRPLLQTPNKSRPSPELVDRRSPIDLEEYNYIDNDD